VLEGLTQHDYPLTLQHLLYRMRRCHPDRQVVSITPGGVSRTPYGAIADRVDRLASALDALGVRPGDRVGTLGFNSQPHFELYVAVPSAGMVLHAINVRFSSEQLVYVINHAADRVIFVDDSLVELLASIASQLTSVRAFVVIGDGPVASLPGAIRYEDLLASADTGFSYPRLDSRAAAGLCHTSGTTGRPKGVMYSHASNVLHAMSVCTVDCLGMSAADRLLLVVPMFHANGWGLPYAAAMAGADLVLPGRVIDAPTIAGLVERERITIAPSVPTVWMDLLRYADRHHPDLSSLRLLACGGSAAPRSLMQGMRDRHGVDIVEVWGMTETGPLCTVAWPPADASEDEAWHYRDTAGRLLPWVEARIVDEDGEELVWDGVVTGELQVRGPWIASAYFEDPESSTKFVGDWLRTGDVAWIDARGYVKITDRAKDAIKSGGEWISSIELEAHLVAHPSVDEAAVVAVPDSRWAERPLACVVLAEGSECTTEDLRSFLVERVPRWWIPDAFVVWPELPKTSVGKLDKKGLRERLRLETLDDLVALGSSDTNHKTGGT
jgi:fatty-acyl-CoA synthase